MSWDMKNIPASGTRDEVQVTSFFGGQDTGRCLQVGQWVDVKGDGEKKHQFIHLTHEQAMELVNRVRDWADGTATEHNPHGENQVTMWLSGE